MPNRWRKIATALLLGVALQLGADEFEAFKKGDIEQLKHIRADSWSVVGKNIIARGNVHVPYGELELYADQAVVNVESKDIEASGNIRLHHWEKVSGVVKPRRLAELENSPDTIVTVTGVKGDELGDQMLRVEGTRLTDSITADRVVGNLESGYFRFDNAQVKFHNYVCRGDSGERRPDGVIEVKNARISSCNYLESGNAHYAIAAGSMRLIPHRTGLYGVGNIDTDRGDHTVWLTNGTVEIYGIPVLWLPVFYKPKDESPGLFSIQFGKNGDWGYYGLLSKRFDLLDYPSSSVRLLFDIYEKRGYGYGVTGDFVTERSKTAFLAYSIYDLRPYESEDYDDYRLKVPHGRFDFRISNLTHITPRLDFRGAFEYVSDYYFRKDFFSSRFDSDPQPATFAALEQQFDHFSAAVYYRPQVVKSYSTAEKLPEFRIDVPRQELFGTGIYYQGDLSGDYFRMRWIDFDYEPKIHVPDSRLRDYEAFRFDMTHFLYYPISLDWLTLVPRAGVKMTAYSNSSEKRVSDDQLIQLFLAADPQSTGTTRLRNYDDDGGSRVRVAWELGVEASTKIHNTWQNVRSSWFGIDGLRHIFRPFVNYTYIGKPTESREHLYYFDDIDRIDKQNFIRIGMENRLQTRERDRLVNLIAMENYLDVHLEKEDGFGYMGNFGTVLELYLMRNLWLTSQLLVDTGDSPTVVAAGDDDDNGLKWLNRWNISLTYEPIEDVKFRLGYDYINAYRARSAYSMGSTLTQIDAGSYFNNYNTTRSEDLTIGVSAPLTPDRRTFGAFVFSYDFVRGHTSDIGFSLSRQFHCVELIAYLGFEYETSRHKSNVWDTNFSVQARLTGLEGPINQKQNETLASANRQLFLGGGATDR